GGDRAGHALASHQRRAGAAAAVTVEGAAGSGDDLPEMSAEGAGQALRPCRGTRGGPAALSGEGADRGAASGGGGAGLALVPTQPGGGGPAGGGGSDLAAGSGGREQPGCRGPAPGTAGGARTPAGSRAGHE